MTSRNTRGYLRRLVCALLILCAPALFLPSPAAAEDSYRSAALSMVGNLVRLFPPAEGFVVSLPEGQVYVDLAEEHLMRPGMELVVFREGSDIVHPVTGAVLGKYEDRIGFLTVAEVHEKYSVGEPVEGSGEIVPGDRVRISARPLRALLFFSSQSPSLDTARFASAVAEAAEESERFRMSDEPEWLPRLSEEGLTIEEATAGEGALRDLGTRLRADLLIVVAPGKEGDTAVGLDAFSLWTGRTLLSFEEKWSPPPEGEEPAGGYAPAFGGASRDTRTRGFSMGEYHSKELLHGGAHGIAVGRFTGGEGLEMLVSDGRGLTLYGWEDGGLLWKWDDKGPTGRRIIHLEGGDVDSDGVDEALVTSVTSGRLKTEILAWEQGEWHAIDEKGGFYMRLLEGTAGETVVLGQRGGVTTVFSGAVREYEWTGEELVEAEGRVLPAEVNIFGLSFLDVDGDGTLEAISLDSVGRLRVFDGEGSLRWESRDRYGGYPARVTPVQLFGPKLSGSSRAQGFFTDEASELSGRDPSWDILAAFQGKVPGVPGREGEGAVVVLPSNFSRRLGKALPNLRSHERGEAVVLMWDGAGFAEVRRSRQQDGYIADITLADADGDGRPEAVLAVTALKGALLKETGSVVFWDWRKGGGKTPGTEDEDLP